MSKLISEKGFTLVEVLCSLGIFSIIFISMMSFDVTSLNIKKNVKSMNNNISIMETLKNNIIYSMSFEELEQLQRDKKIFINNENMTLNKIQTRVMDVFSEKSIANQPYMQLSFLKYELKVYSLRLSLHAGKLEDIIELQCNFYKGDHK